MTRSDVLTIWTVYRDPTDYPGMWVLRGHDVTASGSAPRRDCFISDTIEAVHRALPPGLVRLDRNLEDDPKIVETWV
jgi:hypothetical protein